MKAVPIHHGVLLKVSGILLATGVLLAAAIVAHKWVALGRRRREADVYFRLEAAFAQGWQRQFLTMARRERAVAERFLLAALKEGSPAAAGYFAELEYMVDYRRGVRSRWPHVRAQVAHNLGLLPPELNPEELLLPLLRDPHPVVRAAAVRAITETGTVQSVQAILNTLQESADPVLYRLARHALTGRGRDAVPLLLAASASATPHVRRLALEVLAEVQDPAAAPRLLELVTDPDLEVRLRVARALRFYDSNQVQEALLTLSADPEWQVRAQAARALSWAGNGAVVARLQELARDPSYWVRNNAVQSLRFKGAPGREALAELAAGPDAYAAERAAETLEMLEREEETRWTPSAAPS